MYHNWEYNLYNNKTKAVWDNSLACDCKNAQDCTTNHKMCYLCRKVIVYTAHISQQPTNINAWNIHHVIPKSMDGPNSVENLKVVHVKCNERQSNNI